MDLEKILKKVKNASRALAITDDGVIVKILNKLADLLEGKTDEILAANLKDLKKIKKDDPIYDRVLLDEKRIKAVAVSVREIAKYDSPVGEIIEHRVLENGLDLKKIRTPIGVIGAIFEARPNVTIDIFALCFKAKNACVLKGGSQSDETNVILMSIILKSIEEVAPELIDAIILLPNDRALVAKFLKMDKYVDVIVPRGGAGLINFVRENSKIPVIETGAGVCHTYVDESADLQMAKDIILNAKTQRPSVCNALDTLIIHKSRLKDLKDLCYPLVEKKVKIYADKDAFKALVGDYSKNLLFAAKEENFGIEYLSLKMSIKTVDSLDAAITHINTFGSGHSEAIVTENRKNAEKFMERVDAAVTYWNASTRFTDGGVFGLGAEVGISTQKLHARGPMGVKDLTSYKWQLIGNGQVRE